MEDKIKRVTNIYGIDKKHAEFYNPVCKELYDLILTNDNAKKFMFSIDNENLAYITKIYQFLQILKVLLI